MRAALLAPNEYEIIFNAANTLRQAGRHADAERYYRTAVRLRPTVRFPPSSSSSSSSSSGATLYGRL